MLLGGQGFGSEDAQKVCVAARVFPTAEAQIRQKFASPKSVKDGSHVSDCSKNKQSFAYLAMRDVGLGR